MAVASTTAFNWWKQPQHQQSAVEVAGNSTASSTVTTTAKVLYILQSTVGDGDSVNTSKLSDDSGCDSKIIKI